MNVPIPDPTVGNIGKTHKNIKMLGTKLVWVGSYDMTYGEPETKP